MKLSKSTMSEVESQSQTLIGQLLFGSRWRVFRFEQLDEYSVPEEQGAFRLFLSGSPIVWPIELLEFLEAVRRDTARGIEHIRVRLVPPVLSPYIRFEFEFYKELIRAGAEVRIIERSTLGATILSTLDDYYLFDDKRVVRLLYLSNGSWAGEREVLGKEKAKYIDGTKKLMSGSVSLPHYLRKRR